MGRKETARITVPAGHHALSCRVELAAPDAAVSYLPSADLVPPHKDVRIITDSQSVLLGLAAGPTAQSGAVNSLIWTRLRDLTQRGISFILQWVPGHAELAGNELADEVARTPRNRTKAKWPSTFSPPSSIFTGTPSWRGTCAQAHKISRAARLVILDSLASQRQLD